jgi:hypothetical protein
MDVVKWLVAEGADVLRLDGLNDDGDQWRPSELADEYGHSDVAAYLREYEEIAVRKARNEKRRQKQKQVEVRRQAAAGAEAEAEAEGMQQQQQQQQ